METSFPLVTARSVKLTNQRPGKQCVGICGSDGALYGRKAEERLVDYFLERRVTEV